MMISTKGRYALRVMTELAQHNSDEFVSLTEISEKQEISLKYLEAIIALLNKNGLVESRRGKSGGYRLYKKPCEYTVREILSVTEGGIVAVNCAGLTESKCSRSGLCRTLPVWKGLEKVVNDYLDGVSLEDLL